jgi:DNA-binding response OmpR family regulator
MHILVVGRNKDILETILRLLNSQPGWKATGALTDEEALKLFSAQLCEIVLLGGGVDEASEKKLTRELKKMSPLVKIVQHYGGGSGLLFAEIFEAMKQ